MFRFSSASYLTRELFYWCYYHTSSLTLNESFYVNFYLGLHPGQNVDVPHRDLVPNRVPGFDLSLAPSPAPSRAPELQNPSLVPGLLVDRALKVVPDLIRLGTNHPLTTKMVTAMQPKTKPCLICLSFKHQRNFLK